MITFEPDTCLPAQFYALRRGSLRPEVALYLSILETALDDLRKGAGRCHAKHREAFREAQQWILGENTCSIKCATVCEVVGIDHDALISGLRRCQWKPNNTGNHWLVRGGGQIQVGVEPEDPRRVKGTRQVVYGTRICGSH